MRLLILGKTEGPRASPKYRGTYRNDPHYHEQFSEDHELNQAFLWYVYNSERCEQRGPGIIHDLPGARNLVRLYKHYLNEDFDIIEATIAEETPEAGGLFLGFDVSKDFVTSLLWNELESGYGEAIIHWEELTEERLVLLRPLVRLVEEYFRPKLNSNGLFDDHATATLCVDCLNALEELQFDLFGCPDGRFEVVKLYQVSSGQ